MIVSDEYLDEILDRYDAAKKKNIEDFLNKHNLNGNNMTDINLDNVEVKSAGFTAVVNDKEIKASVQNAQKAEEARAKDVAKDVPFTV